MRAEVALGKVEGRKSLSLSATGRENVVTFHLPLWLHTEPILLDC